MSKANPRFRRNNSALYFVNGNIWRVRIIGAIENQLTVSSFYYIDELGPGTATLAVGVALSIAFQGASAVFTKYCAAVSGDWLSSLVLVDSPTNPTLATIQNIDVAVGTGPAGHEPTVVGAVVAKLTAVKGQCGRGHITTPAVPTAWVTGSNLSNQTAHTNLANAMVAPLTGSGHTFTPCLYSPKGSHANPIKGYAPLTNCLVRTTLGTVRRRKLGRGK
jgi:hypothetical protein